MPKQRPREHSHRKLGGAWARLYSPDEGNVPGRIADVLDVLIHDGYLQDGENGYHFPFRLLRDWWSNRFRDQHTPLAQRFADEDGGLQ